jgi:CubicO group peptidase (beta-lactamase class C family)
MRLATLLLLVSSAAAADPTHDFLAGYLARHHIPGLALLVRRDGKVVREEGYGLANVEHAVPVTPETVFQSGSMGKQFTSMLVMMLIEEHQLELDDLVSKYLPVPPSWSAIRIRHLLSHTAGLGDYPESMSLHRDYTEDELLQIITAQPLLFAPGAKWSYSNLGYVTLGILVHKRTGRFYGDLLRERIFAPLGMTATRIISEAEIIPHRAAGYQLRDGALLNQEWVAPSLNTTADGSLYLTVRDLARWSEALDARKLVGAASYEQLFSPVKLADGSRAQYGFGWAIATTPTGHRLIEHGGAWQGFTSYIARFVDDRLTVVVLCNLAGADVGFLAHRVAGFYEPKLAPPPHRAAPLEAAKLKAYEGVYHLDALRVTLRAVDGRLRLTFGPEQRELTPESESDFFEEDADRTYHFLRDAQGRVTGFEAHLPRVLTLQKVD